MFLFIVFGLTVFVFSLIVAIVIALVLTVLFVLSAIGIGLMFFFPIIFFTTLTACFLFLLGLVGYWIFKKFNQGEPGAPGDAIGDKLNDMTGGKLNFLMGPAREKLAEDKMGDAQQVWSRGPSGYYGDKEHQVNVNGDSKEKATANGHANGGPKKQANADHSASNGQTNGTPKKASTADQGKATTSGSDAKSHATNAGDGVKKNMTNATNQASKAPGVNEVSGTVKGTPKKLNNATGTVKGATGSVGGLAGGATGLN